MATVNAKYRLKQDFKYEGNDWWKWSVWLEGNEEDLNAVDHVTYTLHPTFPHPVRKITDRAEKFKLASEGWGTFTLFARVTLKDGEEIALEHELDLEYPPDA